MYMTKLKLIVSILTITVINSCVSNQDQDDGLSRFAVVKYNNNLPLDSFAVAVMEYYQLPGVAIATIDNLSIAESAITGSTKSTNGMDMVPGCRFQIGSCGKSFTALLVSSFVEKGVINWDSQLKDVLPDMIIHNDFSNVTIKQLLSHTSGLLQYWTDTEVFGIHNIVPGLIGNTTEKRMKFTQWNLSKPALFQVGEFHYSNGGYVIIASILETLTGSSYEELIQQRVFNKLKLKSAMFGYACGMDDSQPYRHMRRDSQGVGITLSSNDRVADPIFNPAGNISLTINDLAAFLIYNMSASSNEYNVISQLFKEVTETENGNSSGMGWQIINVNGIKTFGHTGSDGTIRCGMSFNPGSGKGVVFATNIGDPLSELAMVNVIIELLNLN
jgi:D-alanyl-D-alanine carboxypeptidase